MGSERLRTLALAAAALAAASLLFHFGTGLDPLWWAPWCGTFVLLAAAPRLPAWGAFAITALAWFLGSLYMLPYALDILAPPAGPGVAALASKVIAVSLSMVLPSLVLGAAVALFRAFARRGAVWQAALIVPALWTGFEFLVSRLSPHGTFGALGYTQLQALPLVQFASVAGVSGLSFCVLLLPAALAALLARRSASLAIGVALFFASILGFGLWRLAQAPPANTVKAGLIASDLPRYREVAENGADTQAILRDYLAHASALEGADIIILPEKLGVTVSGAGGSDDALLQGFADRSHALVVAGLIRAQLPRLYNEARIYRPSAAVPLTYDKEHMLPQFESRLTPGTSRTLLREPSGLWGAEVCKDMDFPALSRAYGNDGVGLLLVPAWDFDDDNWLHARMAILRGVESGFTLVRAARDGLLTISDDRGRVIAWKASNAAPFATLLAAAPVRHDATLYARFGDWFGWLCLLLVPGLLFYRSTGIQISR
ncbi:MAG TPA: nitrilase-related carbon-nitrogen hydrolase [Rhizomicrobium sp.]|jgi:apolipoprotein N-acyltransferase